MTVKFWIEAMRLRTLPVSVAGVAIGTATGPIHCNPNFTPAILCFAVAILAQIASNFANEYYDNKYGIDTPDRSGPRRLVAEGYLIPRQMLVATYIALALACTAGLFLLLWGDLWLIAAGIFIAIGVMAYSAGPYPLSHHALGEVAVVIFYGILPVSLTSYLVWQQFSTGAFIAGLGAGLMGANVLIVNNYRDRDEDKSVGKRTLAVAIGPKKTLWIYLINGLAAAILIYGVWPNSTEWPRIITTAVYLMLHIALWLRLRRLKGSALNSLLGATAMLMAAYALSMLTTAITLS